MRKLNKWHTKALLTTQNKLTNKNKDKCQKIRIRLVQYENISEDLSENLRNK